MPRHYLRPYIGFDIVGFMRHLSAWYILLFSWHFFLYYMPSWLLLLAGLKIFLPAWNVRGCGGLFVTLQLHALPRW